MSQPHGGDRLADAQRLIQIECRRTPGGDMAEAARTRADIAQDHDGRRARRPAFPHVGALCGLADGVQALFVDEFEQPGISRPAGHFHLEPRGFATELSGFSGFDGQHQMVEGVGHGWVTRMILVRLAVGFKWR
jgi:hypothetical protein